MSHFAHNIYLSTLQSRHSDPLMVFCCSFSALQSLTIWPREVFSCRNFILHSVTTFWGIYMSLKQNLPWQGLYIGRLSWSYVLGWTFLDLFYLLLMQPNLCWIIWFDQQSASKSLNESKFNCLLLSQIKIYTSSLLPDMTQKRWVDKKKKETKALVASEA